MPLRVCHVATKIATRDELLSALVPYVDGSTIFVPSRIGLEVRDLVQLEILLADHSVAFAGIFEARAIQREPGGVHGKPGVLFGMKRLDEPNRLVHQEILRRRRETGHPSAPARGLPGGPAPGPAPAVGRPAARPSGPAPAGREAPRGPSVLEPAPAGSDPESNNPFAEMSSNAIDIFVEATLNEDAPAATDPALPALPAAAAAPGPRGFLGLPVPGPSPPRHTLLGRPFEPPSPSPSPVSSLAIEPTLAAPLPAPGPRSPRATPRPAPPAEALRASAGPAGRAPAGAPARAPAPGARTLPPGAALPPPAPGGAPGGAVRRDSAVRSGTAPAAGSQAPAALAPAAAVGIGSVTPTPAPVSPGEEEELASEELQTLLTPMAARGRRLLAGLLRPLRRGLRTLPAPVRRYWPLALVLPVGLLAVGLFTDPSPRKGVVPGPAPVTAEAVTPQAVANPAAPPAAPAAAPRGAPARERLAEAPSRPAPAAPAPAAAVPVAAAPAPAATARAPAAPAPVPTRPVAAAAAPAGRPASSSDTCTASIQSTPSAQVTLGDKRLGSTPVRGAVVPCGQSTLVIRHPRYRTVTQSLSLTPDDPAEVAVRLSRPSAELHLTSSPPGAMLKVNGQRIGPAPRRFEVRRFETVRVEASLPGQKPWRRSLYVRSPVTNLQARLGR